MTGLLIFIGGGLGSLARYGVSQLSSKFTTLSFPIGTFISNALACIILAFLAYNFIPKNTQNTWIQPLLIIGFCGGFSTFSSFSIETVQLFQLGNTYVALLNILISLVTGFGIIYVFSTR